MNYFIRYNIQNTILYMGGHDMINRGYGMLNGLGNMNFKETYDKTKQGFIIERIKQQSVYAS